MSVDRLEALLQRFSVRAEMFHSGALCGLHAFPAREPLGQLHLIKSGAVSARHARARPIAIREPSILFYPRPFAHRLQSDTEHGANMTCAHVRFGQTSNNPLAEALPPWVIVPLRNLDPQIAPVLELLFAEAFGQRCGRQAVVDRLFEVVLIHLLRDLLDTAQVRSGLLAGLADPRLRLALNAIHADPGHPWSLAELAARATLSRSSFAVAFLNAVQQSPGEYLTAWRMSVAQDLLRRGRPLKSIHTQVGYLSAAAFSRAFKQQVGRAPSNWLSQIRQSGDPLGLPAVPG